MILRPLEFPPENFSSHTVRDSQESADRVSSAWAAVERKQKQAAEEWLLIAQPDHAALAEHVVGVDDRAVARQDGRRRGDKLGERRDGHRFVSEDDLVSGGTDGTRVEP